MLIAICIAGGAGLAFSQQPSGQWNLRWAGGKQSNPAKRTVLRTANACSPDSLVLTRQSQVDSFRLYYPTCTTLRYLVIDGTGATTPITRLDSLKYITEIEHHLNIKRTAVPDLSGFSGLKKVGGWIWFERDSAVTALHLTSLTHLGLLVLDSLPNLASMAGIMDNLESAGMGTIIISNTGLEDLAGLARLESVPNLYINSNRRLKSLSGLQNLRHSDYGLSICCHDSLTDISALSGLTEIREANLEIFYNQALASLQGVHNITYIGRGLTIQGNGQLTNLNDLHEDLVIENKPNDQGEKNNLKIEWNGQLSLCSAPAICRYLGSGEEALIQGNAEGCNDADQILANCTETGVVICENRSLKTWTGSVSDDWNEANNWSPAGVPAVCDSVLIPDYPATVPKLSQNTAIGALTMQQGSELRMNGFGLTVHGDLRLTIASIGGGTYLAVSRAQDISISECMVNINSVTLRNYAGVMDVYASYFNPDDQGTTVLRISDTLTRNGSSYLNQNYINGNLELTVRAAESWTTTNLGGNSISGDVKLVVKSPGYFTVGDEYDPVKIGGSLQVETELVQQPNLNHVEFTGDNDETIIKTGAPGPLQFNKLSMRKGAGSVLTLNHPTEIQHEMYFNDGRVKTDSVNLLVFASNASVPTFGSGSYVWGPAKKMAPQNFTFPIGDETTWGHLNIRVQGGTSNNYTAQYFRRNPATDGMDTSKKDATLQRVSGKEYWKVTEEINIVQRQAANDVFITLTSADNRSEPLRSVNDLRVAHWSGTQWKDKGNGGVAGSENLADVTSAKPVTEFGYFTLGYTFTRIPVITLGEVGPLACVGQALKVPISLDTLMLSSNQFTVQLSDSTGSFANPTNIGTKNSVGSDTITAFIPFHIRPKVSGYRLRVIGSAPRDTSVNTKAVTIGVLPQNFAVTGPLSVCAGTAYKYYATKKEAGVAYTWKISWGSATIVSNGDTAFVTPTAAGSISLDLSAANSCGTITSSLIGVQVLPPPPSATPSLNNIGRWLYASAPLPVGAAGYRWFRNDTLINGAAGSSYYASARGSFTVRFFNSCGNSPASNAAAFAAASVPQTISFVQPADKLFSDAPFALQVSTSSGLPVQLAIISGPGTLNGNTYTLTGTGQVTIRATQLGDAVYDTAAPVIRTFTVNKGMQTISFAAIADQTYGASPFALDATASSGLPVGYSILSGPAFLYGNLLYITGPGTVTVQATQAGNGNYFAATPVDRTFCVTVPFLTSLTGPLHVCPGQSATYNTSNISGLTYKWRLSNGTSFSATSSSVSINWNTPGAYTLQVSATGSCGEPTATASLTVNVINAITPGAVSNMLPVTGATGLALPLQLSWLPGNEALSYDLFVWDAAAAKPSTPYLANLTGLSYVLPAHALAYNKTYKWQVISKNACLQTAGPVQEFRLKPLPDLVVSNVQVPPSANSGQTVSFSWRVANIGPGHTTTNQSWTDAVFLSFDSVPNFNIPPNTNPAAWNALDFPVRPLLVGTKPNVTSLDSGQQYTNTINFTLPVNYSQPLYVYVITNYQPGANAPLEMTRANDTARSAQAVAVVLSPTPDLRVDTVLSPLSVFSGSTVNVAYKVKNYGVLTPAGSGWSDRLYISQTAAFNPNTAIPLKLKKANGSYYPNAPEAVLGVGTQLQADSAYSRNMEVVIPNFIFGSWFLHVVTNHTASLYEGALATNNTNSVQVQVFLTPTPQLTVTALTVPLTTASVTERIGINWTVFNKGFHDNIEKAKGHYFVTRGGCTIPCQVASTNSAAVCNDRPGITVVDSMGFGSSYWVDKVYISTDSGGINGNAVFIGDVPHGSPNSGLFVAENPLASSCEPVGTIAGGRNLNTATAIQPGSAFQTPYQFMVPGHLPSGKYYVYVFTNATKSVYEYPGTPQVTRSALPITVQRPDLALTAVTVAPNSVGGQPVTITYNVKNEGPGSVFNTYRYDRIYVSTSPVFDNTAQVLTTISQSGSLPAGASATHSFTHTFPPGTSGLRYFYVQVNFDSTYRETTYANNRLQAVSSNFSTAVPADLMVTAIPLADTVQTMTDLRIRYTVQNKGTGPTTGTWTDSVFVACQPQFDKTKSFFIGWRRQSRTIAGNESYTDSFTVNLPLSNEMAACFPIAENATAYFFVKTNADNGTFEGDQTANNLFGSGPKRLVNPVVDHVVTAVTGGATAAVGRSYTVGWTVQNNGVNPGFARYSAWFDAVYFSTDSVFDQKAILANHFYETQVLGKGQAYSRNQSVVVPRLAAGDYYVFVVTNYYNSIYAEQNRANNANLLRNANGTAKKIAVSLPPLPDLVDTVLTVAPMVAVGQPLTIIHRIKNNGAGATFPEKWSNEVWLSGDFIPGNAGDIRIAAKNYNTVLQPGGELTDTLTAFIDLNTPVGNYVLINVVDAGWNIVETTDANNHGLGYVTVFRPAPADLLVQSISAPDTLLLGYPADGVQWVIRNNSSNSAEGVSTDGIYLSKGAALDSTAVLLGVVRKQMDIPALGSDTVTAQPVVNGLTEGAYNLLVRTDLLNNIVETDKTNNVGISVRTVYVKVKELLLDVTESNTLHTAPRLYKLSIPDSLKGSTIRVALQTPDSLRVRNELFVGYGYVPTAARFDYRFGTPNYGNQQIIITSVAGGDYYVLVRTATANPPVQNISLRATVLPFAVLTVQSNSGGNIGNVTVRLNGSLFTEGMTAKLTRGNTTIPATAVYFTNSTQAFATFNLKGAPLGTYSLTLNRPDNRTASLPNSFTVVPANNGGIITGGGNNTGGSGTGSDPGCDPGAPSGLNSQLVTELVAPEKVFAGWPFVIQINYSNPSNFDVPAQVRILYNDHEVPVALTQAGLAEGKTSLYLELTEPGGPPGIIRAGGSGIITVYGKAPVTTPGHTFVKFSVK